MMSAKQAPPRLGDLVARILKENGWKQQDLARELRINQASVSRMKTSGDWQMHYEIISKLLSMRGGTAA